MSEEIAVGSLALLDDRTEVVVRQVTTSTSAVGYQAKWYEVEYVQLPLPAPDPELMHLRSKPFWITANRLFPIDSSDDTEGERHMYGCEIERLVGKKLKMIEVTENEHGDRDSIIFTTADDEHFILYHDQDCCEYVYIEDIIGDMGDLVGAGPILRATEDSSDLNDDPVTYSERITGPNWDPESVEELDDSHTWTFYNIASARGHVTIRWYGASNGYYSESVDFDEVKDADWTWMSKNVVETFSMQKPKKPKGKPKPTNRFDHIELKE